MNSTISFLLYSAAIPALAAGALVWVLWRLLPDGMSRRSAVALAMAAAFSMGYALLPSWAAWVPERHWQWLPQLGLAAAILGPVSVAHGVSRIEWHLLALFLACLAAWMLVPTWETLRPPRPMHVTLLAGYLYLFMAVLTPLACRSEARQLGFVLPLTAMTLAGVIAACVSVRYGQVAGMGAFACAGCRVAAWLTRDQDWSMQATVPVYCILVGGIAFVAHVEPEPRLYGVLLVPLAPCGLWIYRWPKFDRLNGAVAAGLKLVVVLAILCIAALLSLNSV